MAFSPENKPFINSAFYCSVGVVGKWEPFPFSLRNLSCEKEGVGGGVRWNGGSSKMGHKGWPWMPRRLLSSLPGPWDLWVKICQLNLNVSCAHIKSLLRKPSQGRREREERKKKKTHPDSLLLSEPFVLKWDERWLRDVNGNLCKYRLKVSSIQRVTQP